MQRFAILFIFMLGCAQTMAQEMGYSINAGLRKTFIFSKKSNLYIRQQLQLTPEIERYNNEFGDFFNEEGFWPVPDQYQREGGNNALPGMGSGVPNHGGELNDTPTRIEWAWRSTTSWQYNYRPRPWIRANTGYALFYNGEECRHTLRAELDYRPLQHSKRKKPMDVAARVLWQHIRRYDDGDAQWRWSAFLVPRADVEWAFKKNHFLVVSPALNGFWEKGALEWDRFRVNTNLVFVYQKIHRFTFSYQFQQRLDTPDQSQGLSLGYEVRL
jgi:hypothetical protein